MSGVRAPSSGRAAGEAGVAHEMGRVGNQQVLEHAMDAGGRVGKLNAEAGPGAQPGPASAVSPEVSPSTAPGAPLMETAPALGASLNGVKPQGAMGEEKSPFEASLLQQYQQAMLMQLQAQMALGGLLPNHLMGAVNPNQLQNLGNMPNISNLPHLPGLSAGGNVSSQQQPSAMLQQQLPSLPALSNPLRSFSSMQHDDFTSQYNNMISKGTKHLRAFHSTNENTSNEPVRGGIRKASQMLAQRSNSMSMLDGSDLAGYDPTTMDEKDLKKLRRKQSNRESARRSRLRKQAECESLQGENHTLKAELQLLRKENTDLKDLVMRLQDRLDGLDRQMKHVQRATPEPVEG